MYGWSRAAALLLVGLGAAVTCWACSSSIPLLGAASPIRDQGDASQTVIEADWNDVEGSVAVAVGQAEVAIEGSASTPDTWTWSLRSVGAIPGTLTISRPTGSPDERSIPLTLTCRFGHFRDGPDRQRERRVLERVAARLRDLAGRDYAPIR